MAQSDHTGFRTHFLLVRKHSNWGTLGTRQDILDQTISGHHTLNLVCSSSCIHSFIHFHIYWHVFVGGMTPENLEETQWGIHTQIVTWAWAQTLELWGTNYTCWAKTSFSLAISLQLIWAGKVTADIWAILPCSLPLFIANRVCNCF